MIAETPKNQINQISSAVYAGKGSQMKKLNKNQMVSNLKVHGVKVNSKLKVVDVAVLYASKSKVLSMGNRTGEYFFGSKIDTWAGKVCRAIAFGEVNSTSDIRKKITKKYGFRQTLGRLADEGLIRFTDKNNRNFELTTKGHEVAAMYKSQFAV
jgi:hypothetical protein